MTRGPVTWARALRAAAIAILLFAALAFAAANFVLVDVHVLTLEFQARLAWVVLVPCALAFGAGVLFARAPAREDRSRSGD
jgi:hypothetical protein